MLPWIVSLAACDNRERILTCASMKPSGAKNHQRGEVARAQHGSSRRTSDSAVVHEEETACSKRMAVCQRDRRADSLRSSTMLSSSYGDGTMARGRTARTCPKTIGLSMAWHRLCKLRSWIGGRTLR